MKTCRGCGSELVVGVNWTDGSSSRSDYRCSDCEATRQQRNNEAGYRAHRVSVAIERYSLLAFERGGECEDHWANFGRAEPYSPELRAMFQWDHRYGPKSFRLNIAAFERSMEGLRAETAKCAFVCGNCHLLATQRSYYATVKPDWVLSRRTYRVDRSAHAALMEEYRASQR